MSILYLQKGIVFAGLVGLVLLGRWLFGRDIKFAEGLLFAGSVVAGVLPYVVYLLASGRLETFVFWNFTYNTLYYQLRGWEGGKLVANLNRLLEQNSLTLLFFATTLLLLRKKRLEWELLFLATGVFGFSLLTGRQNPQYYLLAFPPVAVLAAHGFTEVLVGRTRIAALTLLFLALVPLPTSPKTRWCMTAGRNWQKFSTSLTSPNQTITFTTATSCLTCFAATLTLSGLWPVNPIKRPKRSPCLKIMTTTSTAPSRSINPKSFQISVLLI